MPLQSPIDTLLADAAASGTRVLDLRAAPRGALYRAHDHCVVRAGNVISLGAKDTRAPGDLDFGAWGYFRTKRNGKWVYAETPPLRGENHGSRPWVSMTCTVIHTAAVVMHAARYIGVPVQHGIAKDGTIVLCHGIDTYCYHADGANRFSDGIEISGRSTINAAQIVAVHLLLRYIDAEKAAHGVKTRCVTPHAFSQSQKPNDCGAQVWPHTGQWAQDVLGMKLGPVIAGGFQPAWVPGTPSK